VAAFFFFTIEVTVYKNKTHSAGGGMGVVILKVYDHTMSRAFTKEAVTKGSVRVSQVR
jgi:hypothetical protein